VISIMLNGVLEIKFYALESKQLDLFSRASHAFSSTVAHNHFLAILPKHFIDIVLFAGFVFVLVMKGSGTSMELTLGDLAIFGLASSRLLPAAQSLYQSLSSVAGNIDVLDLYKMNTSDDSAVQAGELVELNRGAVIEIERRGVDERFARLSFSMISFEIGKHYILHGESGVGKSSIFLAMVDLIRTQGIEFRVDKRIVEPSGFAGQFLLSTDSGLFFDGTVSENVDFFSTEKHVAKLREDALRLVRAEFVDSANVDQRILDDGRNFSKGERQRLALARVLISRNRRILLVDEALTGLPVDHERAIYSRLFQRFDTVISISHRKDNDDLFSVVYSL